EPSRRTDTPLPSRSYARASLRTFAKIAVKLGRASLARQEPRIDPLGFERRRPALVGRRVEQDLRVALRGEPAVTGHFLVELSFAPAGIAERRNPSRRAAALGDHAEHVDRAGHCE